MSYTSFDFPHTHFYDDDLREILKRVFELNNDVKNFVSVNAIKYADPIQWDITSQYEKNTIVIDPQSGTAYISVAPVPIGVALTNTDFWTVVFDLERFVTKANGNFTLRVEEQTTLTATFPTPKDGWIVWGGVLYEALTNIIAGDQYVEDSNIQRLTVEEAINRISADLDAETLARKNADEALQHNIDAEALARKNADEVLQHNIDAEALARKNADEALQHNIDAEALARENADEVLRTAIEEVTTSYNTVADMVADTSLKNGDSTYICGYYAAGDLGASKYYISNTPNGFYHTLANGLFANIVVTNTMCPEQFGAKGDGVADDTVAINNAVTYAKEIVFTGNYRLNSPTTDLWHAYIKVPSNRHLFGNGTLFIDANSFDNYSILDLAPENSIYKTNVIIEGLTLIGDKSTHTGTTGQWGFGIALWGANNITIRDCNISDFWGDAIYVGRRENDLVIPSDIVIESNILNNCRRNNISIVSGERVYIHNNIIRNASGQNPQAGIDLEPDNYRDLIDSIVIDGNKFIDNYNWGVLIVGVYQDSGDIYNTRRVKISNNEFTGITCTAVRIVNNIAGNVTFMAGPFDIVNNEFHNCFTGVTIHKAACNILKNIFRDFTLFTNEHIIYCDNGTQADINIKDNLFKLCRSSQSIIYTSNAYTYVDSNTFENPNAPITIDFDTTSAIANNVFSSYYSGVAVNVIKYSGSDGGMYITNNTVLRRGSNAALVFVNSAVAAPTGLYPFINNNCHMGVSFTNITNAKGSNNYLNGTPV